ncbi:chaplin [Streptomyces tubercidicus]
MKFVSKAAVLSAAAGVAVAGGAGVASAYGAGAAGVAQNSPGVLSGNLIQVPVDVPVNVCGNTVNIVALLNPAFGNTCLNA